MSLHFFCRQSIAETAGFIDFRVKNSHKNPMGRPRTFDENLALRAATETFREYGYAEATPQRLADAMGLGKGSLYHAFGSKHELFIRCLKDYAQDACVQLEKTLQQRTVPIGDRLREVFASAAEDDSRSPETAGCLLVNTVVELGPTDEEAGHIASRSFEKMRSIFLTALQDGVRSGDIMETSDLGKIADHLQSALIGQRVLNRLASRTGHTPLQLDPIIPFPAKYPESLAN